MSFVCTICNYKTNRQYDLKKHNKTKRHLDKVNINAKNASIPRQAPEYRQKKFICIHCRVEFKYLKGLNRHMKRCASNGSAKRKFDDISIKYEKLQEEKELLEEKYTELYNKYEDKRDLIESDLIKAVKKLSKGPNMFSFVVDNFTSTQPLKAIRDEDVPELKFLKDILKQKNGKIELCEELQHHSLHKTLKDFVGDHVVDNYKENDKTKQQFFVTDCSRLNYLVRDVSKRAKKSFVWKRDSKGLIVGDRLIEPILRFFRKHLEDMTTGYLDYAWKEYHDNRLESVKRTHRLFDITKAIDDGTLRMDILKYLAPHFYLDKTYIEQCKDEYLVHIHKKYERNVIKKKTTKKTTKKTKKKTTNKPIKKNNKKKSKSKTKRKC